MSHHIEHIEISNFKSIRHATIEGCKRINVFIGYPNVGKSNILEALSFFSLPYLKAAGSKKLTDFIRLKNLQELSYGVDVNAPIKININKNALRCDCKTDVKQYYPLECEYSFKKGEEHNVSRILFDTHLNVKFEDAHKNVDWLGDFPILKYQHPTILKHKNSVFPSLLPPSGTNIFDIINENSEIIDFLKREFEKVGGEYIYDASDNSCKILKSDGEKKYTLPFSSIADTLRRLVFYMASVLSNKNSVILLEEPESHMFPPYISRLMGEIIFERENRNQYFINTHSPFVINDLLEDAREELAVYLVGYKNGQTNIQRLTDEELHEIYQYGVDLFFNIESYLT